MLCKFITLCFLSPLREITLLEWTHKLQVKDLEQDLSAYKEQFDKDQYARLSGIRLLEASPGYAKARMMIGQKHLNSVGTVHGGALFTLADFAFAVASNSHGKVALAIEAEISYFKSVNSGILTAVAKEVSLNHRLGTYLIDIFNEKQEPVAHFKGTVYRKNENLAFEKEMEGMSQAESRSKR